MTGRRLRPESSRLCSEAAQVAVILARGYLRLISRRIPPQGGVQDPESRDSGQTGLDVSGQQSDESDPVVNTGREP